VAIKWIFLDLDNTLWDFDGNAEDALNVLHDRHKLKHHTGYEVDQFVALYKDVNQAYWLRYEKGDVDKETLRTKRFTDTFDLMGLPHALQPENIWQEYLDICPRMTKLMPCALECLELLSSKFKIGILTNGFEGTQTLKLSESGIGNFVNYLQTSEKVGLAKPSNEFFQIALNHANIDSKEAIYIGDNINTDVWGGLNAGILTYWYTQEILENSNHDNIFKHDLFGGIVHDLCHWSNSIVTEF